ncbi:hypothetical protein MEQU1_002299 [Malassezia equina]|uniref:Uncharacterized protein n=1 Tax=Malassezia equina TaxID=1381935 RepID=A0AAF0J443_9BASI|nr:hypothetical protein MEQU1_002299 [Malassezia equina]
MMTSGEAETVRSALSRRRTDGPTRSRSHTNMESIARRARKKNASSTRIHAQLEEHKRTHDASESHWESSSEDEAQAGALHLEMKPTEPAKDSSRVTRGERPAPLVPGATSNRTLTQVGDEMGHGSLSPRTVPGPPTGSMPPSLLTPRKTAADLRLASDPLPGSPRSLRSSSSVCSVHSLLAGHASAHATTTPVGPVLTTTPVVGGHHGTHGYSTGPDALTEPESQHRPTSRSSSTSVSLRAQPGRVDAAAAWSTAPALPRTLSVQSLHPLDGGGLPSSSSRDQLAHLLAGHARRTSASLTTLLGAPRTNERAVKPVVSKFAHAQQQFDVHATQAWVLPSSDETPGRVVSVDVPPDSVYSASFAERVVSHMRHAPPLDEQENEALPPYRYLLDFGLSGPPIDRTALGPAALTPRRGAGLPRENANAEGREVARDKMLVPDSTTTLGPNMIPFHFIHALTSTMESALALDPAEVPAMASLLPGAQDRFDESGADALSDGTTSSQASTSEGPVHWIDPGSMRAIGCTAQAVAMQRLHTVTRRFADPFRGALTRVVRLSGTAPPTVEPRLPRNARIASSTGLRRLPTVGEWRADT